MTVGRPGPRRPGADFPPRVRLYGRGAELRALGRLVVDTAPSRLALVGTGGSGKSVLAIALGHALAPRFGGRVHWFRVGAWDHLTLLEMLALRFGVARAPGPRREAVRAVLAEAPRLLFLDNHEDDEAMARLLDALDGTAASCVITARRCLLGGVLIHPVTPPLAATDGAAFPRVAGLTRALRYHPLALDIADAIVSSGAATASELAAHLERHGVSRVRVIDHEDDLPEVALLVGWSFPRLPAAARRMLGTLAWVEGDHVDARSLCALSDVRGDGHVALDALLRFHLVQEPLRGRFTVHAVVRHAVRKRTRPSPRRYFEHYVALLEREPARLRLEQTHLFAAMDHAHREGDLAGALRVDRLAAALAEEEPA